jgi:hypothetical protein
MFEKFYKKILGNKIGEGGGGGWGKTDFKDSFCSQK